MSVLRSARHALVVVITALALLAPAAPASGAAGTSRRPDDVVLLVGGSSTALVGAEQDARTEDARVRHKLPQVHALSLGVAPHRAAALQRRLERRGLRVEVARRLRAAEVPNDTSYPSQQQYLENIKAPAAWGLTHGSSEVTIAIIDSGVNTTHPDLVGKVNASYNAVDGTTNVSDASGHGTMVAGVAGASTNNGVGIAGSGYDSSLMAIKVADAAGNMSADDLIKGITWAADHGADVINISLSGGGALQAEANAVTYALDKGALVVAAAGNDGGTLYDATTPNYPAAYDGVIAVAALDPDGHSIADFSSHGPWVDLGAPGRGIWATTRTGGYDSADGTSFSSPLVAGAAALLRAHTPSATVAEIRSALLTSAGEDFSQGFGGILDMSGAFDYLVPRTQPTITSPLEGAQVSGAQAVTVASSAARVQLFVDGVKSGARVSPAGGLSVPTWGLANGPHVLGAADCTLQVCSTQITALSVDVQNSAPTVTAPAGDGHVFNGGTVTLSASSPGGAVRFLLDGVVKATDTVAPYQLSLNTSLLTDGDHTLQVVGCNATGSSCLGPSGSRTFTVVGLHPRIVGAVSAFSPNGDGRADTAPWKLSLPDSETVSYTIKNWNGTTVLGPVLVGSRGAGTHSFTWSGKQPNGVKWGDGTYTLTVTTSAGELTGLATAAFRLDTAVPILNSVVGSQGYVFPIVDGYRDTVKLAIRAYEPITLNLRITNSNGTLVKSGWLSRSAGAELSWTWNGRLADGRVLAAGTYSFWFVGHDPAQNFRTTARFPVNVSHKRVVTKTVTYTRKAYMYEAGGSLSTYASGAPATCAKAN